MRIWADENLPNTDAEEGMFLVAIEVPSKMGGAVIVRVETVRLCHGGDGGDRAS